MSDSAEALAAWLDAQAFNLDASTDPGDRVRASHYRAAASELRRLDASVRAMSEALEFIDGYFSAEGREWRTKYPEMMIALGAAMADSQAKGGSNYEPILYIIGAVVESARLATQEQKS